MKVITKDFQTKDFNLNILELSILRASYDENYEITRLSINKIITDIVNRIVRIRGYNGTTSIYEIVEITYQSLFSNGYANLANRYKENQSSLSVDV